MSETTYTLENAKSGRSKCGVSKASPELQFRCVLRPKKCHPVGTAPSREGSALVEDDELTASYVSRIVCYRNP